MLYQWVGKTFDARSEKGNVVVFLSSSMGEAPRLSPPLRPQQIE
ncbi:MULTISPECIES: hypothetical protein [unclassified Shewanella]|nr:MULTISPECIES: hypothetical protein [unclassified Shewanella]